MDKLPALQGNVDKFFYNTAMHQIGIRGWSGLQISGRLTPVEQLTLTLSGKEKIYSFPLRKAVRKDVASAFKEKEFTEFGFVGAADLHEVLPGHYNIIIHGQILSTRASLPFKKNIVIPNAHR